MSKYWDGDGKYKELIERVAEYDGDGLADHSMASPAQKAAAACYFIYCDIYKNQGVNLAWLVEIGIEDGDDDDIEWELETSPRYDRAIIALNEFLGRDETVVDDFCDELLDTLHWGWVDESKYLAIAINQLCDRVGDKLEGMNNFMHYQ